MGTREELGLGPRDTGLDSLDGLIAQTEAILTTLDALTQQARALMIAAVAIRDQDRGQPSRPDREPEGCSHANWAEITTMSDPAPRYRCFDCGLEQVTDAG